MFSAQWLGNSFKRVGKPIKSFSPMGNSGFAIMTSAGPRVDGFRPHFTLTYVRRSAVESYMRGLVLEYTVRHVPKNSDGYRTLPARPLKKWGDNSFYIDGPLKRYKRGLHEYLTSVVGDRVMGDYRRAHVSVKGDWDHPIYNHISLVDRI